MISMISFWFLYYYFEHHINHKFLYLTSNILLKGSKILKFTQTKVLLKHCSKAGNKKALKLGEKTGFKTGEP